MIPRTAARTAAGALLAAAVLGASACSSTSVLNLEVGQCIAAETDEGEISSVPVVDCAEPHSGEIFSLPQLPDGDFPGDAAVRQSAGDLCAGQDFQTYVGVPYQQSTIYFSSLTPTDDTWDDGDREIVCILLADEQGSETTGSLRGADR